MLFSEKARELLVSYEEEQFKVSVLGAVCCYLPQAFLPSCQLPERGILRKNLKVAEHEGASQNLEEKWQSMKVLFGGVGLGTRRAESGPVK